MSIVNRNQLVDDLGSDLVARFAHQEMDLFRATSEAYFKNPAKMLKQGTSKDESLGFGVVEVSSAILMSPIILKIVDEAIKSIVEEVKETGIIKKLLKKIGVVKDEEKKVQLPLAPEQMRQVHDTALKTALQFNLTEPQARLLADSLVGRLALVSK